jgi:hypothetical protein
VSARARILAAVLLAALVGEAAPARGDDLSTRRQALLLLRVLVYDRNLQARAHGAVRVAVVFRAGDRRSEEQGEEMAAAMSEVARQVVAAGLPVEVLRLPYRDAADFEARLEAAAPTCLYVCDALRPEVKEIARAARQHSALAATASREMVNAGLALGVVRSGLRWSLIVNLPAAREEGVDLDAELLEIAEVIR